MPKRDLGHMTVREIWLNGTRGWDHQNWEESIMSEYINNSAKRKEEIKALILDLHAGGEPDEIRERFRRLVGTVSAVEIARLEQELIDEGLPAEDVTKLCDVHVSIFEGALESEEGVQVPPGHPVHTFKYENFAAGEVLGLLEEALTRLPSQDALGQARSYAEQLGQVERIYLRKENLLFPFLERHGVSGPTSVMWASHDKIREEMRALRAALKEGESGAIREAFAPLAEDIRSMFNKEEQILLPTALKVLDESEWVAIRDQSEELGYCLIRPGDEWNPDAQPAELPVPSAYGAPTDGLVDLGTGALTPEQIRLLLGSLPVDVTFIDETDTVRYYSEGIQGRVFTRTPSVIGRKVQNCHPPQSVHIVNRLLDDFKSGKRDVAEFWIQMPGRFIHIRYFPLRKEDGTYRGTLEVTQDLTPLRALSGERRLLDGIE